MAEPTPQSASSAKPPQAAGTHAPSSTPGAPAPVADPGKRKRALTAILVIVVLAGAAWGAWHWLAGRHVETTDNAYVQGNVVQITPQVAGTVTAILADEADPVAAGAPLVKLDAADAQVALARAEAQLAQTVRGLRGTYANSATLDAQISQRDAELQRATAELARAQADLARRLPLAASGAVGAEEIAHAQAQVATARGSQAAAQAALATAREALAAQQTQTDGIALAEQPAVAEAAARVREAYLALKRSTLPAPQAGVVARRNVQIGQRVAAGTPLMTLVALDQLWVDANFKEPQLERLRIGQPVRLTADVYGRDVAFDGRIAGLGAGTGAAFALLPAQNATGNWIKVVQRVPVRIALDPQQLAAHPLRLGLSMTVSVDVRDSSGKTLADTPRSTPVAQTAVFDVLTAQADAEVARIIATHGGPVRRAGAAAVAGKPAAPASAASAPAAASSPAAQPGTKTIPRRPTDPAVRR